MDVLLGILLVVFGGCLVGIWYDVTTRWVKCICGCTYPVPIGWVKHVEKVQDAMRGKWHGIVQEAVNEVLLRGREKGQHRAR